MKYNNILKEIGKMNSNVEEMEDYKKKREQFSENIRRANREEMFSKRRNLSSETINNDDLQTNSIKLKTLIVD